MKKAEDLIKIADDTLEIIREGGYQIPGSSEWIDLAPSLRQMIYNSIWVKSANYPQQQLKLKRINLGFPTNIIVENIDCVEKAREWGKEEGVVLLNMASSWTPGGGFLKGSKAQEEEICRRTTLIPGLYKYWEERNKIFPELFKEEKKSSPKYPMDRYEFIYTSGVNIIRDKNYNLLSTPEVTNVMTFAAIRKPKLLPDGNMIPACVKIMRNKIKLLLYFLAEWGFKKLILGAWGCGAYKCPPFQVANLFKEVLGELDGYFEDVCFAIIDNPLKKENNYQIFKSVLCQ